MTEHTRATTPCTCKQTNIALIISYSRKPKNIIILGMGGREVSGGEIFLAQGCNVIK